MLCPPAVSKYTHAKVVEMVPNDQMFRSSTHEVKIKSKSPPILQVKNQKKIYIYIYAAVEELVQVLLLLRSSTHTPGSAAVPGYFFSKDCSQGNFKVVTQSFLSLQFTET